MARNHDDRDQARADAFDRVWTAHAERVYAYARRRAGADAAGDIVADTFLVAWRRMEDVPAEPLPWLLGVARRVIANRFRSQRRREQVLARLQRFAGAGDIGTGESERTEARLAVHDALAALRPTDREALMLVAWDGLNQSEAATVLGCRPQTFAVRLHRARRRLARELSAGDSEEWLRLAHRPRVIAVDVRREQ